VLITDVIENQYRALLLNTKTREPVAIRLSDAVLLAYIARLPIYVDSQLMEKQSTPYEKEARNVVIPMNTLSNKMLLDAFDKAVEEEKYELASRLRDEIRRRKLNDPS
jgi:bifunctional DNase/RNase